MVNMHVGTSGDCPICHLGAEDTMHLLFKCPTSVSLWDSLGISSLINDAVMTDRSGSAVLEFTLSKKEALVPGFQNLGQKEVILVGVWYLWWIRRRITHEESVPLM
jgi:hypothetical protein